jgi:hypothetical protein
MQERLTLSVGAIHEAVNADKEFRLAARFWYARIRFFIGADQYFMRIEDGAVTEFVAGTEGFDPYSINIGGPVEIWEKMLAKVPPPYYQSFLPAQAHYGLTCGGDLRALYAHYAALERILVVMRRCNARVPA